MATKLVPHLCWGIASVVLVLVGALPGQVSRGTILGTVVDPSGNRVPKARVMVRQSGTNFDRSTSTDELGDYELVGLAVGQYTVDVEAAGFSRESRTQSPSRDRLRSSKARTQRAAR